jgi:hypothetical protein
MTHWFHENTLVLWLDPWYKSFHTTHSSYNRTLGIDFDSLFGFKAMIKLWLAQIFGRLTIGFID